MFQQFRRQQISLTTINLDELRRQVGIAILLTFAVVGFIVNIILLINELSLGATGEPNFVSFISAIISASAAFMLHRKIYIQFALHLPLIMLLAILILLPAEVTFVSLVFATLIYAAIVSRFSIYAAISVFLIIWSVIQQQAFPDFQYVMVGVVAVIMSGIVLYVINNFASVTRSSGRTNQLLQASSNIAQIINRELDQQALLNNTVKTIRDEFDFYHVQVFMVNAEHTYANLVASTGDAGQQLLARNHRLPIGSRSVIGRVVQIGEPVVTQNTQSDSIHSVNELLPETQAELALPIIDSGNIIGALDVQSINADAFQSIDIQALQIIANQLAVAIRNARLFEQAQQNINENKQLVYEYETNLQEVDRLNRTLTKQSWDNYLTQSYVNGVTLSKDRFAPQAEWSDAMHIATSQNQTHITESEDKNLIVVPIVLRGEVLGAIEVEVNANTNTTDSAEMIQAVSQRLAISLESARLFEETQEATLQEQQINEIVTSYETAVTIDELLHITLEKLQQSLGADAGKIRLGKLDTDTTSPHTYNGNGGSPS